MLVLPLRHPGDTAVWHLFILLIDVYLLLYPVLGSALPSWIQWASARDSPSELTSVNFSCHPSPCILSSRWSDHTQESYCAGTTPPVWLIPTCLLEWSSQISTSSSLNLFSAGWTDHSLLRAHCHLSFLSMQLRDYCIDSLLFVSLCQPEFLQSKLHITHLLVPPSGTVPSCSSEMSMPV